LRHLPLSIRKANLARLLARRPDRIFVSDYEQGESGLPVGIRRLGLETPRSTERAGRSIG
jgi:hypothetical protein